MPDITPVEPVATPADTWTSQSLDATGTPVESETPAQPASPDAATSQAVEPEPPVEPVQARDEAGQFTPAEKPAKRRTNPYEAVREATGETARERDARQKAEARAEAAERELATLRQPTPAKQEPPPQPATGRPRPKIDDYLDAEKYPDPYAALSEDLADWKVEQRLSSSDFEDRVGAYLARQESQRQFQSHLAGALSRGREAYPDFEAALDRVNDIQFPIETLWRIGQMEGTEHIQYALASNPALARKIAGLANPFELGIELSKLVPSSGVAARPDSTSMARSSNAKPPINRVGGTASAVPVDPDDLDFGPDYIKAENERDKKRREASRW